MREVMVSASRAYRVKIGDKVLPQAGQELRKIAKGEKIAVISDSNVAPLYMGALKGSLEEAGFSVCAFVFPAGEASKNGETYLRVLNFLAENRLTRDDMVVALGGGVVGDLSGFAAGTYLRGTGFAQIPTTLLAMVDSSVGGKTAIDLPMGKNLAGCFYQPQVVLCDETALHTLPERVLREGCAEVIKYGVLFDERLFAHLLEKGTAFDREYVIARCVECKRDVVNADEFDRGSRQLLNLGHTVGHGIEKASGFEISHGAAVAAGMAIVARAAAKLGVCGEDCARDIETILQKFALPVTTDFAPEQLLDGMLSDKKRSGEYVNLILPEAVGRCRIQKTEVRELMPFLKAGL